MGLGNFINHTFLYPLGFELKRLPKRGDRERSKTLKTVFFPLDPSPKGEALRGHAVRFVVGGLPTRLALLGVDTDSRAPAKFPEPLVGAVDSRACLYRPGDFAVLVAPQEFSEDPREIEVALDGYLRALGSGALGWWVGGIPASTTWSERLRSRLRLAMDRTTAWFLFPGTNEPTDSSGESLRAATLRLKEDPKTWKLEPKDLPTYTPKTLEPTTPRISFVITCKGRLEQLKETLPTCLAQEDPCFEYVGVDFDCPDGTSDYLSSLADPRVLSVKITNQPKFDLSYARNLGARYATGEYLCFLDADTLLKPSFLSMVRDRIRPNRFLATTMLLCGETGVGSGAGLQGYGGIMVVSRQDWLAVRGFDETLTGWGAEDDDFRRRLLALGRTPELLDLSLTEAIEHDDEDRTRFYDEKSIGESSRANSEKTADPRRSLPRDFGLPGKGSRVEVYAFRKED